MISGDKLLYNLENVVNKKPITADLFLTNYCNNRCKYCTYNRWDLKKGTKFVSFEEFKRNFAILNSLGCKGYILTGGGEPTVNPDFDKITDWLEAEGVNYGINTNFNILKKIKPVYLKISLDGYDEQSYMDTRGVNSFNKVINNIKEYILWKKKNKVKTNVGVQSVVLDIQDIDRFYNVIKDINLDFIVFRPVESTAGSFYKDKSQCLVDKIIKKLTDMKKTDNRIIINYKWNKIRKGFNNCSANLSQIAVNEYSQIIYCCHKPYEVICEIDDPDLDRKRREFVTNMKLCDIPCRLTAPNEFVDNINNPPSDSGFI